jgi:diaminopimelate decarboxylase
MDEEKIREKCRIYVNAMKKYFGGNAKPLYASKACSFMQMYRIMKEENMGVDVVSTGEMYTALKAGYDMKNVCFHSNNKSDYDISFAIDCGVGCFVSWQTHLPPPVVHHYTVRSTESKTDLSQLRRKDRHRLYHR